MEMAQINYFLSWVCYEHELKSLLKQLEKFLSLQFKSTLHRIKYYIRKLGSSSKYLYVKDFFFLSLKINIIQLLLDQLFWKSPRLSSMRF
jgi:hypothetical protein